MRGTRPRSTHYLAETKYDHPKAAVHVLHTQAAARSIYSQRASNAQAEHAERMQSALREQRMSGM